MTSTTSSAAGPIPPAPAAFPKLSPEEVREIRQMFRARAGFPAICRKFGVTADHARHLCLRDPIHQGSAR
jgi:hypothetical protein